MKKDHKKISDIVKKRNDIAELLIIEQNQYMPFLKELQKQADELNTITEKIHFWGNEKQKYLNGIDSYTFASSGIVSLNMPANTELFLDKEITKEINKLKALIPPQQNETKTDKLKAPVLGLFCSLMNKIGIDKKNETESATVYCERICGKFNLPYTDRVRQNYSVTETKKLIQELTEKVLPLIDNETKKLVEDYLDKKQPPKQILHA